MSGWTRRDLLKRAAMSGAVAMGGAAAMGLPAWLRGAEAAGKKPNIILFLSDDVGIDLISCYGADKFKTPHIDALAKAGTQFMSAYCAPLCGPTRCLVNTGRYAFRTGGLTNSSWSPSGTGAKSAEELPIAKMLKQAGYATCSAGKWRQIGETPGDWGYDEWITDDMGGGWYWEKTYTQNGKAVTLDKDVYCPDVYHDFAMDFIKRHKDGPFFLYYPTHLIHTPTVKTPDSAPDSKDLHTDNVAYMDKLLGRIVAQVDQLGIRENTLLIFMGDNGTAKEAYPIGGRALSGFKGSMLEGGAHVPLIVSWKGVTPEGAVNKDLIDFSDFRATFAELAGYKETSQLVFDGQSFAPQLRGQPGKPREWIFVELGHKWYVREKQWKLNQAGELYDMKESPFVEKLVPADSKDADAVEARKRLQAILDKLNPAAGKTVSAAEAKADKDRKMSKPKKGKAKKGKAAPKKSAEKSSGEDAE